MKGPLDRMGGGGAILNEMAQCAATNFQLYMF
jgi:hypothetical protein